MHATPAVLALLLAATASAVPAVVEKSGVPMSTNAVPAAVSTSTAAVIHAVPTSTLRGGVVASGSAAVPDVVPTPGAGTDIDRLNPYPIINPSRRMVGLRFYMDPYFTGRWLEWSARNDQCNNVPADFDNTISSFYIVPELGGFCTFFEHWDCDTPLFMTEFNGARQKLIELYDDKISSFECFMTKGR